MAKITPPKWLIASLLAAIVAAVAASCEKEYKQEIDLELTIDPQWGDTISVPMPGSGANASNVETSSPQL